MHKEDSMKYRWEKDNGRYYCIYLYRDLLGDWVLTRAWGGMFSKLGNYEHEVYLNYIEAVRAIILIKERRKQRGYIEK